VLLDEGRLTDVRTAVAGAIGAKYLAPTPVTKIGVLGTGTQARLQVKHLAALTACRDVVAWGRSSAGLERYVEAMAADGFSVTTVAEPGAVLASCNLLITTTPATEPLVMAGDVRPGTHINAIGSDTPSKQELHEDVLAKANLVVTDSRAQSTTRGEIARAVRAGSIDKAEIVEIGDIILERETGRTSGDQITVFDSTGVAVQDIQIATAVANAAGLTSDEK
jgi:ornithine cyclodeaminase